MLDLTSAWTLLRIGANDVNLQLYVRLGVRHNIGWDDYTAVASLVSISSQCRFHVYVEQHLMMDLVLQMTDLVSGGFVTKRSPKALAGICRVYPYSLSPPCSSSAPYLKVSSLSASA